jgi:hypothetical protein
MHRLHVLLFAVACVPFLGCGDAQSPASAPRDDTVSVQHVLTSGSWRLVDYRATAPLDVMTQALLAQQIRTMVLTFDGSTMHVQSPTLNLARPYTVRNAAGLTFDFVSPDPGGAGNLRSHCEIQQDGQHITFVAQTNPFNGTGLLAREGS